MCTVKIGYRFVFLILGFRFLDCMPGYSGINCTSVCPYPQYGIDCQRKCNCSEDTCDVSTGCQQITTGSMHIQIDCLICLTCYSNGITMCFYGSYENINIHIATVLRKLYMLTFVC